MNELKIAELSLWDYFKAYKAFPASNIDPFLVSLTTLFAYNNSDIKKLYCKIASLFLLDYNRLQTFI